MLSQIEEFVNWVRRRNPAARTWRDYRYDLQQFVAVIGDRSPNEIGCQEIDHFVNCKLRKASNRPPSTGAWRLS